VDDDLKDASLILSLSNSQIIRLLAKFPEALSELNSRRIKRGQHALK